MSVGLSGCGVRSFGRAGILLGCVLLAALSFAASSARADQFTWLGPHGLDRTGENRSLVALSCPSSSQCTTADHNSQQVTFSPASGAITSATGVDPVGAVTALSCASGSQCTAVDDRGNEITFNPAEGSTSGAVSGIDSSRPLTAVDCPSSSQCTAVDGSGNEITFDPSTGAVQGGGAQPVDGNTALRSLSCPTTAQCTAVDGTGREVTFVPVSDSPISGPVAIDGANALSSVSCPAGSSIQCTAVDGKGNEITFDPTSGNGTGVKSVDGANALTSVSCPATTQCTAVDSIGQEVTFASATGAPISGPQAIDGTGFLQSVSCPSGSTVQCTAVDNRGNEITFDPTSAATNAAGVKPLDGRVLSSVDCPQRTQCTAVDDGGNEVTFDPASGAPNAVGIRSIDPSGIPLVSVSCPTSTQCTAVEGAGPNEVTFDPTSGTVNPPGPSIDTNALAAVACPSRTQCTAVDHTGSEVTFDPTSGLSGPIGVTQVDSSGTGLKSVSCPSSTQCTTVNGAGSEVTFSPVTFDPVTGAVNAAGPRPVDSAGNSLNSVSCPTSTQCTAVDTHGNAVTFNPVTGAVTTALRSVDLTNPLASVSCPSATQCTAVDALGNEVTFNPTSSTPTAPVVLQGANGLQGVDCNSISLCAAVDIEGTAFAGFVPPASITAPTISGTAQQGQTLTEAHGNWTDSPTSYTLQWQSCDSAGNGCAAISGATGSTYAPQAVDVGRTIRVQEIATNQGGPGQPASAVPTVPVTPPPPVSTGAPTISGTAQEGQALTETAGMWTNSPASFSLKWLDCDSSGSGCSAIAGATGQTYVLAPSDVGHAIRVQEVAANAGGSSLPSISDAIAVVAPAPKVTASTLKATAVTSSSAVLHGVIQTGGAAVARQFQYGLSIRGDRATPMTIIPAGRTTAVAVAWPLSHLQPNTPYHFRVTALISAGLYAQTARGLDLTFTTKTSGRLLLRRGTLKIHHRAVVLPLSCQSQLSCNGRVSITARTTIGTGRQRHVGTILCNTTFARIKPNRTARIHAGIYPACYLLAQAAHGHRLTAKFAARPRTGQQGILKQITLTL